MQNTVQNRHQSVSKPALDYLFHPASIAIVGVAADVTRIGGGRGFLESLIDIGFPGGIYPVNLEGGEIMGLKVYPSVREVPYPVDHVISAVSAQGTAQVVRDCSSRGVKAVHIFSAGFGEIADPAGKRLEEELTGIARETGIRIIGPNCMGLYCPEARLAFFRELSKISGSLGYISQSGSHAAHAVRELTMRGVYFSKAVSYGNACDLNESDFLEYLAQDPETRVIGGYIEGVRDGDRFARALKTAAAQKPVIIFKAGATEEGTRAVASHTGVLAGSGNAWKALLRQVGAIQVHSMEELVDLVTLFKHLAPPRGRNVALIGIGGGAVVQSADEIVGAGLRLPLLPPETRQKLLQMYSSEAGASFRNPIDMYWRKRELIEQAIRTVAECRDIDLVMVLMQVGVGGKREIALLEPYVESIVRLSKEISRRTIVIMRLMGEARFWQFVAESQRALAAADYAVYTSARDAAVAIARYMEYHGRLKG